MTSSETSQQQQLSMHLQCVQGCLLVPDKLLSSNCLSSFTCSSSNNTSFSTVPIAASSPSDNATNLVISAATTAATTDINNSSVVSGGSSNNNNSTSSPPHHHHHHHPHHHHEFVNNNNTKVALSSVLTQQQHPIVHHHHLNHNNNDTSSGSVVTECASAAGGGGFPHHQPPVITSSSSSSTSSSTTFLSCCSNLSLASSVASPQVSLTNGQATSIGRDSNGALKISDNHLSTKLVRNSSAPYTLLNNRQQQVVRANSVVVALGGSDEQTQSKSGGGSETSINSQENSCGGSTSGGAGSNNLQMGSTTANGGISGVICVNANNNSGGGNMVKLEPNGNSIEINSVDNQLHPHHHLSTAAATMHLHSLQQQQQQQQLNHSNGGTTSCCSSNQPHHHQQHQPHGPMNHFGSFSPNGHQNCDLDNCNNGEMSGGIAPMDTGSSSSNSNNAPTTTTNTTFACHTHHHHQQQSNHCNHVTSNGNSNTLVGSSPQSSSAMTIVSCNSSGSSSSNGSSSNGNGVGATGGGGSGTTLLNGANGPSVGNNMSPEENDDEQNTTVMMTIVNAVFTLIMTSVLRIVYKGYDALGSVLIALSVRNTKEKVPIPPIGDRKLLLQSASDIADMIRNRKVTSEEVVRMFIGRIQEVNTHVNGLVDERFEIAIDEAKKVDRMIQSGEFDEIELKDKFPLLGVPFTIKDSFCVAGLRHTAGLYYRKDIIAPQDADAVKSLKRVGAIPIGVTNVPELCMWWESVNTVYGRSRNPYDTRHITGGSSGGEAAVQGAAGSAFGIGSDIAGSIRMPSFFCGIFGHKPTSGLMSHWGQQPEVKGRLAEFLTTGPMVRHAKDLRLIFDVLVGENVQKMNKIPEKNQLRILFMEDDGGSPFASPVDPEMKDALRKAIQHLEKTYGVKAQKANIAKLYNSLEIWAQAMSETGAVTFCEELALKQGKINPFWEIVKFCFRMSPHTFPALILGIIEKMAYAGNRLPRHKQMIEMGFTLAKEIQEILKDDAVLLYPSFPGPAPRHYVPMFRPADFSYCAIFNVLGVPVSQVPLGLGSKGLPLGVQIVGGMHSDHITISIAEELERAFGGWVQPCPPQTNKSSPPKLNKSLESATEEPTRTPTPTPPATTPPASSS